LTLSAIAAAFILERALGRLQFFSMLTFASAVYAVIFAIVPLADLAFSNPDVHDPSWQTAAWLGLAGYFCLAVGYFGLFALAPTHAQGRVTWNVGRALRLGLGGIAIAVAAVVATVGGTQGVVRLVQNFARRGEFLHPSSIVTASITLAPAAVALVGATWANYRSRKIAFLALCVSVPLALAATSYSGSRWRAFTILVTMTAIVHLRVYRLPKSVLTVLAVGGIALFIYAGQQRNIVGTGSQAPNISGSNFYYNYVGSQHDVDQFRDFVTTLDGFPSRVPFQMGRTFLSVIPKAPFPTGGQVFDSNFYPTLFEAGTSIPNTLPGELYMNFAVPGILFGMAMYGALLAAVELLRRWWSRSPAGLAVIAYSLLPVALIIRGDFTTFGGFWLVGLVALMAATLASTTSVRRPASAASPSPDR
jgi:oligosaccharide repeat unit polymerase